jgi:hypothetical protein
MIALQEFPRSLLFSLPRGRRPAAVFGFPMPILLRIPLMTTPTGSQILSKLLQELIPKTQTNILHPDAPRRLIALMKRLQAYVTQPKGFVRVTMAQLNAPIQRRH